MKITLWQTISQNQTTQSQIERRNQGYKRMLASSLVSLAVLVLASPAARATTMDQFTLMSGTDTVVFTLPSSPTPTGTDFDCQAQLPPQFCISGVSALVNGIAETGDTLEFFDLSQEGGLAFSNGGPFPLFDSLGEQLYSGPVTAPTFLLDMVDQISFPDGGSRYSHDYRSDAGAIEPGAARVQPGGGSRDGKETNREVKLTDRS